MVCPYEMFTKKSYYQQYHQICHVYESLRYRHDDVARHAIRHIPSRRNERLPV